MSITNIEELNNFMHQFEAQGHYTRPRAFGVGLATVDSDGVLLDTYFPCPNYQGHWRSAAVLANILGYTHGTHSYQVTVAMLEETLAHLNPIGDDGHPHPNLDAIRNILQILKTNSNKVAVVVFIGSDDQDTGPRHVPDAYLRLHLLSHRLVKPHALKLDGIFGVLPNVAWTSEGPIGLKDLQNRQMKALAAGHHLTVHSVDKFPRMVDYVIPTGVRIADASRVRLGAYLGEGTTVMHEGFVNFNAGCEGPNMIEGRISGGVFVQKGSDLGGGCSTMGTLSGGGSIVISVGENCLLGANSGLGIPLGDRCTIEAGLYLTAGTKVTFNGQIVKARDLAHKNDILFRRNSQTGQVEALVRANTIELNPELHS